MGISSYHKHVLGVFLCGDQVSKLKDIFKTCEINFLSEIASKCSLERLSVQKRVTVQLKGECFAPPSAMNHKMHCAEQILAWTWDRQVKRSCEAISVKRKKYRSRISILLFNFQQKTVWSLKNWDCGTAQFFFENFSRGECFTPHLYNFAYYFHSMSIKQTHLWPALHL